MNYLFLVTFFLLGISLYFNFVLTKSSTIFVHFVVSTGKVENFIDMIESNDFTTDDLLDSTNELDKALAKRNL